MKYLSIVIPYYKGLIQIQNCIECIYNSYNKSKKGINFEIIIVIDSIDDQDLAFEVLSSKYENIRIHMNSENLGVAKSREIGLEMSNYQFVTFIDQDDQTLINYFKVIETRLDQKIDVFILNGFVNYEKHGQQVKIFYKKPSFTFNSILKKWTNIPTPGLIIFNKQCLPHELFIDTSENYKGCDDWAAYMNLILNSERLKIDFINHIVFRYNIHALNFSHNHKHMRKSALGVLNYFIQKKISNRKHNIIIKRHIKIRELKYRTQFNNENVITQIIKNPITSFNALCNYIFLIDQHIHKLKLTRLREND